MVTFSCSGTTISGERITTISGGSLQSWTASYTASGALDIDGPITYTIAYDDLAGNIGTSHISGGGVTFDNTPPKVKDKAFSSNNLSGFWAKVGHVLTLNFTTDEPIQDPVVAFKSGNVSIDDSITTASGGNLQSWTCSGTMSAKDIEGEITYSIDYKDLTGNQGVINTSGGGVIFDKTPPNISGISTDVSAGKYGLGKEIDIKIVFSEVVNVSGIPELYLNSYPKYPGTTNYTEDGNGLITPVVNYFPRAIYYQGSGTNELTFKYIVQHQNYTKRLDYITTNSINLSGGFINDWASNESILTLPSLGANGLYNANIYIDTQTADNILAKTSQINYENASGEYYQKLTDLNNNTNNLITKQSKV